jgi:plasmid maintenance system antidote protein VapI
LAAGFGGSKQNWLAQQNQYDLAHIRRKRIQLKRLAVAQLIA